MYNPFSLGDERRVASNIYAKFQKPKIICGIKDENVKISLNTSKLWMLPLLGYGFLLCFLFFETYNLGLSFILATVICSSISVFWYCGVKYQGYFENDKLIYRNKLGYKKVIDIKKNPKIYATYSRKEVDTYDYIKERFYRDEKTEALLYIEQENVGIVIDIYTKGNDKIELLLDNLIFKEVA